MAFDARQLAFDFYARHAPVWLVRHADPSASRRRRLEARAERLHQNVAALKREFSLLSHEADEVVRAASALLDPLRERVQEALASSLDQVQALLAPESDLSNIERHGVSRLFDSVSGPLLDQLDALPELRVQTRRSARTRTTGTDAGSLRALFKQLALACHPDHAKDAPDRARRHLVMREVTEAYAQGDVARLLDLQAQLHGGLPPSSELVVGAPDRLQRLSANNRELERQRRRLVRRVTALRQRPWGHIEDGGRFVPSSELQDLVQQSEAIIAGLSGVRELLCRFAQGELSLIEVLSEAEQLTRQSGTAEH